MNKFKPKEEVKKIENFITSVLAKTKKKNVILGLSGGIDSAVSLHLLSQVVPKENLFITHLYYYPKTIAEAKLALKGATIQEKNISYISIKSLVDQFAKEANVENERLRLGNIMARVRMILLFDFAKKVNGLVCGTENKSEYYLGYFTRFGDEASDFEPIQHLYKTQIFELANYLNISQLTISQAPSAGLWDSQTDEKQFGFTYNEADQILYQYFEKKLSIKEIEKQGFPNTKKVLEWTKTNQFKHEVPYTLEKAA